MNKRLRILISSLSLLAFGAVITAVTIPLTTQKIISTGDSKQTTELKTHSNDWLVALIFGTHGFYAMGGLHGPFEFGIWHSKPDTKELDAPVPAKVTEDKSGTESSAF